MPCLPPAPSLGIPGALLKNQFPLTPCSLLPTSAVLGAKGTQAGGHFSGGRCNNNKMDKVGQTRILLPWFSLARLWVPQFQCGHKQRTALGCCGLGQAVKFRDVCEPHWPRKCTGITGKDTSMKKIIVFPCAVKHLHGHHSSGSPCRTSQGCRDDPTKRSEHCHCVVSLCGQREG